MLSMNGRPRAAQEYPNGFCDAILKAVRIQLENDKDVKNGVNMLGHLGEEDEEMFIDDIPGKILDPEMTRKGREKELSIADEMGLYEKMTWDEARSRGAKKFIKTRWVETLKGLPEEQEVRSRLVAKEIARTARDDLFSPTPSLESLRWILSKVASRSARGPGSHRVLVLDVQRAFFYAPIHRDVFIELPSGGATLWRNCGRPCMGPGTLHRTGPRRSPRLS